MRHKSRTKKAAGFSTSRLVRTMRLELIQANAHYPLKVACLPFHHVRRKSSFGFLHLLWDCKDTHKFDIRKFFSKKRSSTARTSF